MLPEDRRRRSRWRRSTPTAADGFGSIHRWSRRSCRSHHPRQLLLLMLLQELLLLLVRQRSLTVDAPISNGRRPPASQRSFAGDGSFTQLSGQVQLLRRQLPKTRKEKKDLHKLFIVTPGMPFHHDGSVLCVTSNPKYKRKIRLLDAVQCVHQAGKKPGCKLPGG